MSLRARLALALGGLAAAAVLVVGVTAYVTTEQSLRREVDRTLTAYGARINDRDGDVVRTLCGLLPSDPSANDRDDDRGPIPELPGSRVQCVDSLGRRVITRTSGGLPVDAAVRSAAIRGGSARFSVVRTDDGSYRVLTVPVEGGGAVMVGRSLNEAEGALADLRLRFLVIGVVVTALAALVGWLIATYVTRPLDRLTDAASRIAETGALEADLPAPGRDEVGRLAGAFATMIAALTRSRDQQQQLAQDAGHELRTPLTSVRANIDTLKRHPDMAQETRDRVVGDLDSEARELTALTEELLDLVADRRDAEPAREVELAGLVERAVERSRRRNTHTITLDAAPCRVLVRPALVLRAVGNLLENAAKFAPTDTTIEVRVRDGVITVRDHGPGIPPDDLPHVFDRFYRADDARSLPGSGLGLAIVAQVAAECGGRAEAANAEGGGARMTMTIPRFDPGDARSA